jgi:hypothetical protein
MSIKHLSKGLTIRDLKKRGVSHLPLPAHPDPHPHLLNKRDCRARLDMMKRFMDVAECGVKVSLEDNIPCSLVNV